MTENSIILCACFSREMPEVLLHGMFKARQIKAKGERKRERIQLQTFVVIVNA